MSMEHSDSTTFGNPYDTSTRGGRMYDPQPISADELVQSATKEFIILAGKDGVGKTSAIVSQAKLVEELYPDVSFSVIDTENKFAAAMKAFGADYPRNVRLYKCGSMNEVNRVTETVLGKHKPGDWLSMESVARAWEMSQHLAYTSIAGVSKVEWLEMKEHSKTKTGVEKKGSPIPSPDDFWNIAKGAMEGAFFTPLIQSETLHCLFSTTVKPPRAADSFIKESRDRKAVRAELGIDVGLDGPPRLPYYYHTLCLLELVNGQVTCRVLRDNNSTSETPRLEFPVNGKRDWAMEFMANCRS